MRKPKELQTLQEIFVEVLDQEDPVDGNKNRKKISRREAVIQGLLDKAENGSPAALSLLLDLYEVCRVEVEQEERASRAPLEWAESFPKFLA